MRVLAEIIASDVFAGDHLSITPSRQAVESVGGPQETRSPDPLIKSQVQSGPEPNINKKAPPFSGWLALYSTMAGVYSVQVQAQNKHSGGVKTASPCRRGSLLIAR